MVTVEHVLARPTFRPAKLMAGREGLGRVVRWVHVGEVPYVAEFLKGGELVLTTGVALTDPDSRRTFLDGLLEADAAGVVIELGRYLAAPPADILARAERSHFPVIVFTEQVRFLDLSQDINGLLLSQHHRTIDDLETLSLQLRRALLNTLGPSALLEALHTFSGTPVAYVPRDVDRAPLLEGPWPGPVPQAHGLAPHPVVEGSPPYIRQTIQVFDRVIGDLYLALDRPEMDERHFLACDRTAAALAQDLIRTMNLEQSRRYEETVLLEHLLFTEPSDPAAGRRFAALYDLGRERVFRMVVIQPRPPQSLVDALPPTVTALAVAQPTRTLCLVIGREDMLRRVDARLTTLLPVATRAGLSTAYGQPEHLSTALMEAHDAFVIARHLNLPVLSYQDLGLYRWVLATDPAVLHKALIEPELGPVLLHDQHRRPPLLPVLAALLDHLGSKSEAAAALGIHRQTLYNRIGTLATLLGQDFLAGSRPVALQAAIMAWRFLHPGKSPPGDGTSVSPHDREAVPAVPDRSIARLL